MGDLAKQNRVNGVSQPQSYGRIRTKAASPFVWDFTYKVFVCECMESDQRLWFHVSRQASSST